MVTGVYTTIFKVSYRQIIDKGVRRTIDSHLNREEANSTMFREAFNKIQDTGSLKDWGITKAINSGRSVL